MANEKRLIDANALKLKAFADDVSGEGIVYVQDIDEQPTVDAVEVVHGHWCWEGKFKACSRCGSYVEWDETLGANFWKFCPYCGAKMDGDGNV